MAAIAELANDCAVKPGQPRPQVDSDGPVHQLQPLHPAELTDVVAHHGGADGQRMTGDPEAVGADRCGTALQGGGLNGVVRANPRTLRIESTGTSRLRASRCWRVASRRWLTSAPRSSSAQVMNYMAMESSSPMASMRSATWGGRFLLR